MLNETQLAELLHRHAGVNEQSHCDLNGRERSVFTCECGEDVTVRDRQNKGLSPYTKHLAQVIYDAINDPQT